MRRLPLPSSCAETESGGAPSRRLPDRGGNLAFVIRRVVEVINRDNLSVRTLHAACIAKVPTSAIIAQNDLVTPRFPRVRTDPCPNSERSDAAAIGHRKPAVLKVQQARWVVRLQCRPAHVLPRLRVIVGAVKINPVPIANCRQDGLRG